LAVSALKFGFGDFLLYELLFKTSVAPLGDVGVYFVVSKLFVLAYFWATNEERILTLKLVSILKCVKIREYILNF